MGVGSIWKSLYLVLTFAMNLKFILKKKKSIEKKCAQEPSTKLISGHPNS